MQKIQHIAMASDDPAKAADFYRDTFGWKELRRFGLDKEETRGERRRTCGVFMTDGHINIAILRFGWDQLGKGLDYTGLHHFGVVVDDTDVWMARLEAMGLECIDGKQAPVPGRQAEIKFRGPDGVVFDISGSAWET